MRNIRYHTTIIVKNAQKTEANKHIKISPEQSPTGNTMTSQNYSKTFHIRRGSESFLNEKSRFDDGSCNELPIRRSYSTQSYMINYFPDVTEQLEKLLQSPDVKHIFPELDILRKPYISCGVSIDNFFEKKCRIYPKDRSDATYDIRSGASISKSILDDTYLKEIIEEFHLEIREEKNIISPSYHLYTTVNPTDIADGIRRVVDASILLDKHYNEK